MNYYISIGGEEKGPYTRQQLSRMWDTGAVTADALYSAEGMTEWLRVEDLIASQEADTPGGGIKIPPPLPGVQAAAGTSAANANQFRPAPPGDEAAAPSLPAKSLSASGSPPKAVLIAGIAAIALIVFFASIKSGSDTPKKVTSTPSQPVATDEPAKVEMVELPIVRPAPPPRNTYPDELRQSLIKENQEYLSANKQAIFDDFHPTGRATSLKVNDVVVKWAGGNPGREYSEVKSYAIRFVLYWQGPLITEGYSEVEYVYDTAIERLTSARVLRSNGITREEIGNAAGELAVELLKDLAEKSR